MAIAFEIRDVSRGTTTVDLYDGVLQLRDASWMTPGAGVSGDLEPSTPYGFQFKFEEHQPITETFGLIAEDTQTNIISAVRALQGTFEGSRLYHSDPFRNVSYWLEANASSESQRRTLIYNGRIQAMAGPGFDPLMDCGAAQFQVELTRHPFWESSSHTTLSAPTLSSLGGMYTFSSIPGDAPARLWWTTVTGYSGSGGPLYKVWAGIRPQYDGVSDFEPLWECEDGAAYNSATLSAGSGDSPSGSDHTEVSSFLAGLTKYWGMTVGDACTAGGHSSDEHFYGSYNVLLRAKVTAGTVGVQLRTAYSLSSFETAGEEIFISSTSWQLYEMGEIHIPPQGHWYGESYGLDKFELRIYAEDVGSAGTLDLDCVVLVPSKHSFVTEGSGVGYLAGDSRPLYVVTKEDDSYAAHGFYGGYPMYGVSLSHREWYLPTGTSAFIIAAQRQTEHVVADACNLSFQYFPRWAMYRG